MKKTRPELRPSASGRPGYAVLVLTGWETENIQIGARAEVCIQRNQDQRFLGDGRQWTASQTWHQVSLSEEVVADTVVLALDPVVVDPLVENPQMTYQVQIRIDAENGIGVMRIREGVLSSHAAGQSVSPVSHVSQSVVKPEPEPALVEVAPIPEPVIVPETKKSNKLLLIALALVLLVAGVGLFAWLKMNQEPVAVATPSSESVTESSNPAPVVAATPAEPPACSAEALATVKDDLIFIQSCLKTNPDSTQVLSVIEAAKKANRCDLAQRLYAFKGQSGDIPVALAYAKEFDPASFAIGCFKTADKETAIYWYEVVLSKDANHSEAKARLDALRK